MANKFASIQDGIKDFFNRIAIGDYSCSLMAIHFLARFFLKRNLFVGQIVPSATLVQYVLAVTSVLSRMAVASAMKEGTVSRGNDEIYHSDCQPQNWTYGPNSTCPIH